MKPIREPRHARRAAALALVAAALLPAVARAQQDANVERGFAPEKRRSSTSFT